ncbi:hypothetical protein ORI20_04260 [Mycobacterium sp. CVI_P3]|uniref:Small CPxCG-related zinc finger protein n=1 Tax=Mycobacterium pinniadriaticum TaxID=2994102 RepID=A0ABT3S8R4_9MYCO|nr:hypothetical protein [Mycobacterium pinniadriaticum]MCX2929474.1 hypothetical protein [Mycobacterium pinniadriaticum]MCX2935898.1 hypothetical protein [Mycobacterium pinniadriaticum]
MPASRYVDVGSLAEGKLLIPFICPNCGRFDIDNPDCPSCVIDEDAAAA